MLSKNFTILTNSLCLGIVVTFWKQGKLRCVKNILYNKQTLVFEMKNWSKSHLCNFIGLVGRVFANSPGDQGSIPGRVIPKTLKMILDTSLLNT